MSRVWRFNGALILVLLPPLVVSSLTQTDSPAPPTKNIVAVNWEETHKHRIGDPPFVRSTFANVDAQDVPVLKMEGIAVHLTVNPVGAVTSATCSRSKYPEIALNAIVAARALKFHPFERDGQPVWARLDQYVVVLPPEQKPLHHVKFPPVRDWNDVRIRLSRTKCYGTCPAYELEIQGNGAVLYEGEEGWVAVAGKRRGTISKEAVKKLVKAFHDADFFSLDTEYLWAATDLPTYEISIEIDGESRTVKDYGGLQVGMPVSVRKLEDLVDEVANVKQWTEPAHKKQ